ncbi:hypothetical protein H5410_052144 [Solanum commersonii]|uniref:Uncharacterized protein n=1 Tax=Solanum commersonii TaxID=4109 RepID=A0A9J5X259_SOLCO|nr:hypothetical protein H5410_052144 [Solanum commersonii]
MVIVKQRLRLPFVRLSYNGLLRYSNYITPIILHKHFPVSYIKYDNYTTYTPSTNSALVGDHYLKGSSIKSGSATESTSQNKRGGCISLAPNEVGDDLYELFVADSEEAKLFRKNIRAYNNIFAFTSFGVKLDKDLASSRKGVYSFKAQGQIYHDLPSLIPNNDRPWYFQLYFYDTNHKLANKMSVLKDANLLEKVMTKIRYIMERNPYAEFFSHFKEHTSFQNLEIRIVASASVDQWVYNKPLVDEVAAIWVDNNNPNAPFERDIAVHKHSGYKNRVKHYYGCCDPLQYPLILPKGEEGWHQGIQKCCNPINNTQTSAIRSP